jgi:hypothetical protein
MVLNRYKQSAIEAYPVAPITGLALRFNRPWVMRSLCRFTTILHAVFSSMPYG